MGAKINYSLFLKELDNRLENYFKDFGEDICCKPTCSGCCEKGDYPLTDIELEYLMQGYVGLDNSIKKTVRNNIKNMEKGGKCPFLVSKMCAVYDYRPIICRVFGLAYIYKKGRIKIPFCANEGKNFSKKYDKTDNRLISVNAIPVNLEAQNLLKGLYKDIRSMYDWFHQENKSNE